MKTGKLPKEDEMRPEYNRRDLGKGVRGKHYQEYTAGHNLVLLDPEVARAFPSEKAVNEALLSLIRIARASAGVTNSLAPTENVASNSTQ